VKTLAAMMVDSDMKLAKREMLLKNSGLEENPRGAGYR
jgi:hypothetical protein